MKTFFSLQRWGQGTKIFLRTYPIFQYVFAGYLIFLPFSSNLGRVNPQFLLRPLLIMVVFISIITGLFWIFFKNFLKAAYVAFLFIFCVFFFGHLLYIVELVINQDLSLLTTLQILAGWIIIFVFLGSNRFFKILKTSKVLVYVLNLGTIVLLMPAFFQTFFYFSRHLTSTTPEIRDTKDSQVAITSKVPDIYIIIMDSYARADVLQDIYNVDNSAFLKYLQETGFYIADQSRSNYIQTALSIASLLNFDYLIPWNPPNNLTGYQDYLRKPVMENKLFTFLKQNGYSTVAFQSGFLFTEFENADFYYQSIYGLNDLEFLIVSKSIFGIVPTFITNSSYESHRQRILANFEKLMDTPRLPGPKIVFAHILLPHPPFVFDEFGSAVKNLRPYSNMDGDLYEGSDEEYLTGYRGQLLFANTLLQNLIQEILEQSTVQPIIILQGDHGPGVYTSWIRLEETCVWERTGILNAYLVPTDIKSNLYPSISPVNSFRIILNGLFDTKFDLLDDNSFYSTHLDFPVMINITSMIDSMNGCPKTP